MAAFPYGFSRGSIVSRRVVIAKMICFIRLSLPEIYIEPAIRSWPGIGAPYRTLRTMARPLTMASLAMASGSALYSSACTGVSCTGCPRNRALPPPPPSLFLLLEIRVKFFFGKKFDQTHVLFVLAKVQSPSLRGNQVF